jgi:hypothetical protein
MVSRRMTGPAMPLARSIWEPFVMLFPEDQRFGPIEGPLQCVLRLSSGNSRSRISHKSTSHGAHGHGTRTTLLSMGNIFPALAL